MVEKNNIEKNIEKGAYTLLEEKDLYQFAKLAYNKPGQKDLAGKVVKKILNEGRGATFDPTEKDQRFQNLKERNELQLDEVKLSEDEVNENQKELDEDLGNVKKIDKPQAFKGVAPQKGKSDQIKEGAGVKFKHPPKIKLAENEEEVGMGTNPMDSAGPGPEDHMEPDGDEGAQGLGDVSALVADLAKVIQQHTGVSIDVEGAPSTDDLGNEPENEPTPLMPPDTEKEQEIAAHNTPDGRKDEYEEEELDEMAGSIPNVSNKVNSMANQMRMREGQQMQEAQKQKISNELIEKITRNVLTKLAEKKLIKSTGAVNKNLSMDHKTGNKPQIKQSMQVTKRKRK